MSQGYHPKPFLYQNAKQTHAHVVLKNLRNKPASNLMMGWVSQSQFLLCSFVCFSPELNQAWGSSSS